MSAERCTDWQPLLKAAAALGCSQYVERIAEDLLSVASNWAKGTPPPAAAMADTALFLSYYSSYRRDEAMLDIAARLSDEAVTECGSHPASMLAHLHRGVLKVAWVRAHLERRFGVATPSDLFTALDEALWDSLSQSGPWTGHFDLSAGLAGFAIYFVERFPVPIAACALEVIVRRLDEIKHETAAGVAWFTEPRHQHPIDNHLTPGGHYAIGVAHGVSGVIAVLRHIARLGIAARVAGGLASAATHWVLAQQRSGAPHRFTRTTAATSRAGRYYGWCWGDLGIAAALLSATGGDSDATVTDSIVDIAVNAAVHSPQTARGACVCHGASGNAHLCNRLYQCTGRAELRTAAESWYSHVADHQQVGIGIGGFPVWHKSADGIPQLLADPSFSTGSSGIGLALLAGIESGDPSWDRLLGLFYMNP